MTEIVFKNPFISENSENLNLIQINFENGDGSTKSEIHDVHMNLMESENKEKAESRLRKKDKKNSYKKQLGKKFKKSKEKNGKCAGNFSKIKSNKKNKILFKIYSEFKSSSPLYKHFSEFNCIEKNLKNNLYSSLNDLVSEIRNTFSRIFFSSNDSEKYSKIYALCESFEKIYKNYDNKIFLKQSKNLNDIINKLKRELRQTEIYKNSSNNNIFINTPNNFDVSKTKFKFDLNDDLINQDMTTNKYKIAITDKINKLSNEQKKGIRNIITENCFLGTEPETNLLKFDVNKMSINQLKQLEKYVNNCIKENKCSEKKNTNVNLSLINEKTAVESKYIDIKNDYLSSALSDEDDDDEE
jgi:hypothetical protein